MSIKLGTQNIVGLYKGITEIVKRYKGSNLIYESFKWLPFSYEYLYNSLIPETISGKGVKNKAKISKIYANGVIENQLAKLERETTTISGITFTRIDDYTFSLNGTATADITNLSLEFTYRQVDTSHKYLISGISGGSSTTYFYSINRFVDIFNTGIYSPTSNGSSRFNLTIKSGTTFNNQVFHIQLTDLTLMFGTGNEPTTLTDNRIQAILNRGYIAYNTGTYKGTDISEFSSEPYNLFDGELEIGTINQTTGENESGTATIRTINYIEVNGNLGYTINTTTNYNAIRIFEYDDNKNLLGTSVDFVISKNYTLRSNTRYVRFVFAVNSVPTNPQICFHLTGTRTGYAPHQTFSPLSFVYQGNGVLNSHDTFEITSSEYVFTKNNNQIKADSIDWRYVSGSHFYGVGINPQIKTQPNDVIVNAYLKQYIAVSRNDFVNNPQEKTMRVDNSQSTPYLYVRDNTYTSVADFVNSLSGEYLTYELATPQVIRIPKKHLGIVDLGSLEWIKTANHFSTSGIKSIVKIPSDNYQMSNLYCDLYMSEHFNLVYNESSNNSIAIQSTPSGSAGVLHINDTSKSSLTAQQFAETLQGKYLFFETENEVSDIADMIGIEKGGTITSNSQVLPNVDFNIKCK